MPAPIATVAPLQADDLTAAVGAPVHLDARDLRIETGGAQIDVPYLQARLIPNGDYVDLDRPRTFSVTVDALEVRIPEQTISAALVDRRGEKPPFASLQLRTESSGLVIEGTTRMLHLPFTLRATPRVTAKGDLSFALEQVRLLGVGVKGFLGALDRPIEDAVNVHQRLINVEQDSLVVDPFPFLGPPRIRARFTSVAVEKRAVVARLGEPPEATDEPGGIRISGGVFRSEGTLFFDSSLTLVPLQGERLRINPDRFADQQAAGFAKLGEGRAVTLFVVSPDELPPAGTN